jgi:hypothetical protein
MYNDEQILQQKVATNQKFQSLTPAENQNKYIPEEGLNISDLVIALSPLSFVFIWVIFLLILQKIRSHLDNKITFSINSVHQVPCKNCKFFANNHYLKCAVKPDIVMTEEAVNCSEYCPKKSKLNNNKFFS